MKTIISILIITLLLSCSKDENDCSCTEIRTVTTIYNNVETTQALPEQESEYGCNTASYEFIDFHNYVDGVEIIESVKLNCE